jgi:transcription initiation factor IIF auxiliary subunit
MYALLIVACPFVLLLLAIVLSVLLRYTDSDCPFGIFIQVKPVGLVQSGHHHQHHHHHHQHHHHPIELVLRSIHFTLHKKSLKIPKGQSESVYRRRTDNTMAKSKSTKGQATINKAYI